MKITISAYGKFDLFRWAEGFEKKGMLHLLLTDFYGPKSRCLAWRRKDLEVVSPDKVRVFLWPRLAQPFLRKILRTDYWDSKWFDVWAARQIAGSSVVIARSSCALETIKAAKKIGDIPKNTMDKVRVDVNKAMQRPRTLDNAVDSAVGIYLDILNLFLRILELMGKKK